MFSREQYDALQVRAGLLDRSTRGRLQLTGADRRGYLHGLLTNDIVALSEGEGCYAALLTAQGRMISDMRVSELGDSVLIDLPPRSTEAVRSRLADYIFSEDVEVRDVQSSLSHAGLYGPAAAAVLSSIVTRPVKAPVPDRNDENDDADRRRERLDGMPLNANSQWEFSGSPLFVIRSDDYGIAGFELIMPADAHASITTALRAAGAEAVSDETAEVCRIEAGRPTFGIDMDEHTIPLEAGIEDRAISLTKGCYVGQEIIIRVLHRGHGRVAKRLVGFMAGAGDVLARGARLITAGNPEKDVGEVTSAAVSARLLRPIGLGYVHRDYAEPGTILHQRTEPDGPRTPVTIVTVPFTRPAAG